MLKMRYETAEEIPEDVREHYKETDDGFVLKVDGAKPKQDFKAVEGSLGKERKLRRKYESIVRSDLGIEVDEDTGEINDESLEKIKTAVNAYENRRTEDGKETIDGETKEQIEQRVAEKYEKKLEKKDETINELNGDLESTLIDNGLNKALESAGITNPSYKKAVKRMLREDIELKKVDGEKQAVGGVLEKPLEEFVQEFAESEDGKEFVTGKRNSGGGANGSGSAGNETYENPFKPDTFNLTKIGELKRNNSDKAKMLAKEAGVDPAKYGIE